HRRHQQPLHARLPEPRHAPRLAIDRRHAAALRHLHREVAAGVLRIMRRAVIITCLLLAPALAAQTRIASDFEIAQMEKQVTRSRDFLSQLSGHLNLGDLRMTRSEVSLGRAEYGKALEIASGERLDARRASELARYATATAYAGLAEAKLGGGAQSF